MKILEKATQSRWDAPRTKYFGVPLSKSMVKNQDGTLTVRGYFTSDNKDEVGDIITRNATERALPKYRQWGNIRYMHEARPVGRILGIGVADGLEWNEVEILVIKPDAVFDVEMGLLKALSVGIFMSWEDIDFMEDGGMLINDYTLAEISLVDHPANYDAVLKSMSPEQGLRTLVGQYGFANVAQFVHKLLNEEEAAMGELNEEAVQTDAVDTAPVETPQEAPVEEPQASVAPEAEPVAEVIPPAVDDPAPVAENVTAEAAMAEVLQKFSDAMGLLTERMLAAVQALEKSAIRGETAAEVPPAVAEGAAGEPPAEQAPEPAPAEEKSVPVGEPANRSGGVEEPVQPVAAKQMQGSRLKRQIEAYFSKRTS